MRLFPTLITLYVLHHDDRDRQYQRGLDFLRDMNDERLAKFITFPEYVRKEGSEGAREGQRKGEREREREGGNEGRMEGEKERETERGKEI